jgi:hypothetical protein
METGFLLIVVGAVATFLVLGLAGRFRNAKRRAMRKKFHQQTDAFRAFDDTDMKPQ